MKKEVIYQRVWTESSSPYWARQFVERHKNIFAKSVRRYIESSYPVVIKEIETDPDGSKVYWFWVFKGNRYIIYQFEKKPTKKEIKKMWDDIYKEKYER